MSRVMRTICVRHTVFGLALAGSVMSSLVSAKAGDFAGPAYGAYPFGAQLERDGLCRVFHERRIDRYGRETIHRIRMCDEGPVYSPNRTVTPPDYGPRRYYEPSSSDYYEYPRPPAPIGPTYYN